MVLKWNFTAVPGEYDPILVECSEPFPSPLSLKLDFQQVVLINNFLPSERHYLLVFFFNTKQKQLFHNFLPLLTQPQTI